MLMDYRIKNYMNIPELITVIIVLSSLFMSGFLAQQYISSYLENQRDDYGQLADYQTISQILKDLDPFLEKKYVMAMNPAYSYYCGSGFLMVPLYYNGSLEDMVQYKDLAPKIIEYAPKFTPSSFSPPLRADYFIYTCSLQRFLPQYDFLFNPDSPQIPSNFRLIYNTRQVVVYSVIYS